MSIPIHPDYSWFLIQIRINLHFRLQLISTCGDYLNLKEIPINIEGGIEWPKKKKIQARSGLKYGYF